MVNMKDPLDFDAEDALLKLPNDNKKRKNVIGLDDLLTDHYKEQRKLVEKEIQKTKPRKICNSDDDEDEKEALLSKFVEECQNQMNELSGEEDIVLWGVHVFGNQKDLPPLDFDEIESCRLLQSFMTNELNSLVELTKDKGDSFVTGLLTNGWLKKLALMYGRVEQSIALWTFKLMLFSSEEESMTSACDFWCALMNQVNLVQIDWLPNYADLKRALEVYGFLFIFSSEAETIHADFDFGGPPQNIRAWIRFVAACCQIRRKISILSTKDAEEVIEVILCLFLDRQLQGLSMLLYNCMQSVICSFTYEEWGSSCESIAKFVANRVSKDLNCLRIVESISEVNTRSKQLRSAVAYQILLLCFDNKVASEEEILRALISINMRDKSCDLFKMYIYLILTENWLLSNQMLKDKPVMREMWGLYLRNCYCQISSADLRSYALKVRSKAAYLLQFTTAR